MASEPVTAVGIDIGSTNTKVVLVAMDGGARHGGALEDGALEDGALEEVAVHELSVRSFATPDSPGDLLAAVDAGIIGVVRGADRLPQVVGVASMAETGVPLDADGAPLSDFLRWNRRTSIVGADDLAALAGAVDLFSATGVQPGPKAPLALWAALRLCDPALWQRMQHWAGAADLVVRSLTGRLVTDHTLAGRTMAYRLPRPGRPLPGAFDAGLLGMVGLRPGQLPAVARPGAAAGTVTPGAAGRTPLRSGTPVVVAGHDHAVGAWAAGVRSAGDTADSIGTAEALVRILGDPIDRRDAAASGMSLTRTVVGDRESLVAATPHAGSLIADWFLTVIPGRDPAAIFAAVQARGDTPGELFVLPYPGGRQAPFPDPRARLRILDRRGGDVDPATRSAVELTHALLTGMSLHLRWMDAEQRRLTGITPASVRVLGGVGAANQSWLDLKAAVMPEPLTRVAATQPVATGAALLAAVRVGLVNAALVLPDQSTGRRDGPAGGSIGAAYDDLFSTFVATATEDAPPGGIR
jgi:xylulokinase